MCTMEAAQSKAICSTCSEPSSVVRDREHCTTKELCRTKRMELRSSRPNQRQMCKCATCSCDTQCVAGMSTHFVHAPCVRVRTSPPASKSRAFILVVLYRDKMTSTKPEAMRILGRNVLGRSDLRCDTATYRMCRRDRSSECSTRRQCR